MKIIYILIVCFLAKSSLAQSEESYASDSQSADAIINALYEVISGEKGAQRNWKRFENLFTDDARLIPTNKDGAGHITFKSLTPNEYIQRFESQITTDFFEVELYRKTEAFGSIVHVFSTYETRNSKVGPATNRGINSIQLLKTNERYYIMNIFWSDENSGFRLPEYYLKGRIE
jgi:hypothetical protein